MTTKIQCECGKFQAEVSDLQRSSPGRAVCYCDDCQSFYHHIGRAELLDKNGGSEVVPVFPNAIKIMSGIENLRCTRLSPKGLFRFSTTCCKTPIANLAAGMPWVGLISRVFTTRDEHFLDQNLGPIKSRIMAKFAYGNLPPGASQKLGLKDAAFILPFIAKGIILRKRLPSPFLKADGVTPVVAPEIISLETRRKLRAQLGPQ